MEDRALLAAIDAAAIEVDSAKGDPGPALELIGDASVVLLGEASHGTHEFYDARATLTRRLIEEKGFDAVAVEADWPDAYRVNRFVRCIGDDSTPLESLGEFKRFPRWMWRNSVVLEFVGWLRNYNETRQQDSRIGFYGVDLYSLFSSIEAVIRYLEQVDPDAAVRARDRYSCFEHFQEDSQKYGYSASLGLSPSCEDDVVRQLMEFRQKSADYARRDGQIPFDETFFAEQNARLVLNAERYYRSMFGERSNSWNLRDTHMADTIDALITHIQRQGRAGKIVVWEHNSHLGDARFTEFAQEGQINVGQLMRERHGDRVCLVGFSTWSGSVTAADDWDGPAERKRVNPGLPGSYEDLFHRAGPEDFFLPLRDGKDLEGLAAPRLQRAIGVIYRPRTERMSHYFQASVSRQFDGIFHFDRTTALQPLERWAIDHLHTPETYPSGM